MTHRLGNISSNFLDEIFEFLVICCRITIDLNVTNKNDLQWHKRTPETGGNRVTFNQNGFDVICSDVNQLHISTAVAASSAVPVLLSPITFQNFAGSCGYEPPAQIADAVANRRGNRRLDRAAQNFLEVQDVE